MLLDEEEEYGEGGKSKNKGGRFPRPPFLASTEFN
jgi:hypothetical protein